MNGVLLKLYLMTLKGALRGVGRKFSTVRGAILSLVTLGFIAAMFVQIAFMFVLKSRVPALSVDRSAYIMELLPLAMFAYFLLGVTSPFGERAIQFSASEIDFLFPAPFTRRQLLGFYLLRGLVGKLGLAILVAAYAAALVPSIFSALVGSFLSLVFLHGATIAAQLVQQTISAQQFSRGRQILVVLVLLAIGIGLTRAIPSEADNWTRLAAFRASTLVRVLTAPFDVLTRVVVSPRFVPDALPELAIALAMNAGLYWLILGLDARYEDSAVRTSQRNYKRLQAIRGGSFDSGVTSRTEYTTSLVPQLPWWGGSGPNIRRQLQCGLRARALLWFGPTIAGVAAVAIVFALQKNPKLIEYVGVGVLGGTAYLTFILSAQLPFGFRSDLDHMEVLKALPHRPTAIAAAEVVGASLICCLWQWPGVVVGILTAPSQSAILLTGAAFYFPFNMLLFGVTNLILLLFPFRLAGGAPDVTMMGRVMIMMLGNLFAVAFGLAIASLPAVAVFFLTKSLIATLAVVWVSLTTVGGGLLLGVGWAFQRFDVSTDMPD